jgi:hypothetical protein
MAPTWHPTLPCNAWVALPECESASNLDSTLIVHQIVEAEAELSIGAYSIGVQP